jgi:hypothetical protein
MSKTFTPKVDESLKKKKDTMKSLNKARFNYIKNQIISKWGRKPLYDDEVTEI